ncbi:DNA-directed RNA polymerase III subunit RPC7 [Bufo gargarizans]|uniref:DNA-directed RNA polymerase III subunit RPC7 n=1 Tax=Bufo gargarizans TaxID=30331 RepID=UPI001CF55FB3|nr:DNA-directed RNA polymerase III subunit RPC7 [Bufo gargarizans]
MAGKARGRGASFTFDLQAIGFSRGEALPETQAQPMPIYPHSDYKPASLLQGEEYEYLLSLKQELRGNMKYLPYYMGRGEQRPSIDKYSLKYLREAEKKRTDEWTPDWQLLPREMKAVKMKRKKADEKKAKATKPGANVDVLKKIEELEKKGDGEKSDEETEEKKKGEGEEEEDVEVDVEEEENEEDNDYIASYFEDGDDFGNSDDNMDEATY